MPGPAARSTRLLLLVPVGVVAAFVGLVLAIAALGALQSGSCGESEEVGALSAQVPAKYVPIYEGAAARFHLGTRGPAILAAVNFVETSFNTNVGASSAGAEGPMQFLPSTFAAWGVDGDGDGTKDILSIPDAIYSAANYLHDSGAPEDWHAAIFAYNHAEWYVEEVLRHATSFAAGSGDATTSVPSTSTCELPADPTEAVAAMIAEAERLSVARPHTEYIWGGSHGITPTPPDGPFDCSSAVSHLLQVGGFAIETTDTVGLSNWGEPGPGRWVTIWVKPVDDAAGPAHTFLEFMPEVTAPEKRYWGTSGFVAEGHGPGWIPESTFDAGYLGGFQRRHPPGM